MTKQKTIQLPAAAWLWAARVALKAAAKDDVTPVLTAVHVRIADGRVSLIATDRYRVHEAFLDKPDKSDDGEFLMRREQIEWTLRSTHKPARLYRDQVVRITWTEGETEPPERGNTYGRKQGDVIQVDVLGYEDATTAPVFSYRDTGPVGKFPPVRGLFVELDDDDEMMSTWGMNPQFLADLRPLAAGSGAPLRFYTPRAAERKIMPMLVVNAEGTARALVQQNLLLEESKAGAR